MKKSGYILFIALILISVSVHVQAKIVVVDSLQAPTGVAVNPTQFGNGEIVTWKAPASVPVLSYWYVVTRVRRMANGTLIDSTMSNPLPSSQTFYIDNDVVLHCIQYTYYVSVEARIDSLIVESPPSTGVQARVGGAKNAVVIYPISKTLVAVAGSRFYDTINACSSNDSSRLLYSIYGYKPNGFSVDSMTGVVAWNVPTSYPRGIMVVYIKVRNSMDSVAYTTLSIAVVGSYGGNIEGNVIIEDTTGRKNATLLLFNIHTGDVDTLIVKPEEGHTSASYTFKNIDSGYYKMFVRPQPSFGAQPFWYHSSHSNNYYTGDTLRIRRDSTIALDGIVVSFPNRAHIALSGTLRDSHGYIKNGLIQAIEVSDFFKTQETAAANGFPAPPTFYLSSSAETDSGGAFSIPVDSGASYILLASAHGHQSQFIGSSESEQTTSPFAAPVVTPKNGTQSAYNGNLNNSDTTGQQVVGTVKSMLNNSTGVHAMILLLKNKSGTITAGYSGGIVPFDVVSSDDAGNFSFSSIARDTTGTVAYMLQAIPYDSYVPSYFAYNDSLQNKILWENAKTFPLSPNGGAPMEVDVTVPPLAVGSGTINGNITEPSDSGMQRSEKTFVYAIGQSPQNYSATNIAGFAVTDQNGNYTIGNLPMGAYAMIADKVGFQYGSTQKISLSPDSNTANDVNFSLSAAATAVHETKGNIPGSVALLQNYPNPFTGSTAIQIDVPDNIAAGALSLAVFDVLGRKVADLTDQVRSYAGNKGMVYVSFNASDLPAGVYYYRLQIAQKQTLAKQMLLMR